MTSVLEGTISRKDGKQQNDGSATSREYIKLPNSVELSCIFKDY